MRYRLILVVVLLFSVTYSYGQNMIGMYKESSYWGFINLKGEVIIKPKYKFCRDYRSGLAKVGKIAFIDENGVKLKSKIRFQDAKQYHDSLLAIKSNAKWGFIDRFGEGVIEAKYKSVTNFDKGFAIAETKNNIVIINKKGEEISIRSEKKIETFKMFSEGLSPIKIGGKFGFVNTKGELVIKPQYLSVGYFKNGLAWVRVGSGKIGFINKVGELKIEPKFIAASEFGGKMARVKTSNGWTYINISGEIIDLKGKGIDVYKKPTESCAMVRANGLWGYLDPDGEWLLKPQFSSGVTPFKNGYARVEENGKWGLINKKGEWILKPIYDNLKNFSFSMAE